MRIRFNKRLFWFIKDDERLDLSDPVQLDMYVQQVITHGRSDDIKALFKNIDFMHFKLAFFRLKHFLPFEVRKFWEDFLGNN